MWSRGSGSLDSSSRIFSPNLFRISMTCLYFAPGYEWTSQSKGKFDGLVIRKFESPITSTLHWSLNWTDQRALSPPCSMHLHRRLGGGSIWLDDERPSLVWLADVLFLAALEDKGPFT